MTPGRDAKMPKPDDEKPQESLRAAQYARYRERLAEALASGEPGGSLRVYRETLGDRRE